MSPDRRPTRMRSRTPLTAAPAGAFVNFSSEAVMTVTTKVAAELVAGKSEDDDFFGLRVVLSELRNYLARLRLLEGPALQRVRDRLTAEVDRLTENAIGKPPGGVHGAAAAPEPDALDELIERATRKKGGE